MSDDRYRFKLGDFECLAILDNTFSSTFDRMFTNTTPAELAQHFAANDNNFTGAYTCLMVNMGDDDWLLLDTGAGDAQRGSKLLEILEEEDIFPDHIIITHAHIDHYGGLVKRDGSLAFPNAQVYMCRDEWAVFTSRDYQAENPERYALIKQYLMPAEGQIERVECAGEILPGVTMIELPGHSPYHVGVLLESRGETLIFAGDTYIHPLSIEQPEWHFMNDAEPETAVASRRTLAQMAAKNCALVLSYHFEFPGIGHIVEKENSHQWQPLST